MKKFEIINSKWIKVPQFDYTGNPDGSSDTCKIESISRIVYSIIDSGIRYAIYLYTCGDEPTTIMYKTSELELSKDDLALLENILFNL